MRFAWFLLFTPSQLSVLGFVGARNHLKRRSNLFSSNNPFSSMIGDIASSILGGGKSIASNDSVESALREVNSPGWPDVREKLKSMQTPEEKSFRDNLPQGYGIGSPLHKLRLFNENNREEDVRVKFYRDSASWCKFEPV